MKGGSEHLDSAKGGRRERSADLDAEADLLRRLAAGERGEPLRTLADRYARRLLDLGLTTLGDRAEAERLAVETIETAADRATGFDAKNGSPREFVYGVARDRIEASGGSETGGDGGREAISATDFEDRVADVEFRAAVADLDDEERGVLEGILGDGLTRAEVGRRLGLTVGIVELRLRTGLRAVRDELDARGVAIDGGR